MRDQSLASHALAQLIDKHRKRTGDTYEEIAARGGISKSTVNYWATKPLTRMPKHENLVGLAKGLGLTGEDGLGVVITAAQEACGWKTYDVELPDSKTRAIVVDMKDLLPEQLDVIAAAVASFKSSNRKK